MSEYTSVTIERETMDAIERIAEKTRLKKIDIVALAVDLYEKSMKPETTPSPIQVSNTQQ